ncbi:DNA internalization-related competence protein ComEC/Rec2 [Tepidimicrobium xylanilyticum]|uniref:Competence protein ComEC n=1 Tax=Tepidimicrobium xylanilyticum TaxID=1123352 RepID=A0A1H2T7W9_9FIRM|nr:DNA internalization-related competence protein ComEC/Rec2 [Tepidimicrobium xylanilyticum]SDW39334.1 competence protein ComEC [Tepidimicrobium xylanilyticum]
MKRPFVFLTLPLICGIIFYYCFQIDIHLVFLIFLSLILISFIRLKYNRPITIFIFLSLFLLGIILASVKVENSKLKKCIDKPIELVGTVKEVKSLSEEVGRYIIRVNGINVDGEYIKVSEKLILKVIGDKNLEMGDQISFRGVLKEPLPNTNPNLFNYKLNLLTENIHVTMTIRDSSIIDVKGREGDFFIKIKSGFIKKIRNGLDLYLNEKSSRMMKSILLGEYSYLDGEDIQLFRDLGLAHLLAVSGLHIGIVANLFTSIFVYLGINRKISSIITIGFIWFYAYAINFPPSILRANIMFSILLTSQIIRLPYDSINALFFALFILILINPFWIFSIGLQLSFGATLAILFFANKVSPISIYRGGLSKALAAIIYVQIGLLPILSYYFNRLPAISVVANLALMPIFSFSLVLCIILLFFSLFSSAISNSIGIIINFFLNIQFKIMEILSYFPILNIKVPSSSIYGIFIYYVMILMLFRIIDISKFNKRLNKIIVFFLLFIALVNAISYYFDSSMTIEFIDVGQGDSILIRTKEGIYLIDTGGNSFGDFDVGKNILLPYLEKEGIFKLDGVFISHYDADHCKSLPYLIDNIRIENIYLGYEREGNQLYNQIMDKAIEKGIPVKLLKKGDKVRLCRHGNIYVIGPSHELLNYINISDNDLSLVLLLRYHNFNILFTGDIEELGEKSIQNSLNVDVDFLKVPHHGSNTSSSEDFLDEIKPRIGFISVGRNNSFSHPHRDVLERYEKHNIEIFRTDELGLISLKLNKSGYEIEFFLRDKWIILDILKEYKLCIIYLIILFFLSYRLAIEFLLIEKEMEKIELQGIYR